jgi:Barstar (barnase inhibitor)
VSGSASAAFDAARALEQTGAARVASRLLRGTKMGTTASLFDEVAAALQFPPYFGENWNALDECLNDLEWLSADAYVVVILGAVHLLDREGSRERQTFWEIFKGAAREWAQPATGARSRPAKVFRVLAQYTHEEAGRASELLPSEEAGPSLDIGGMPR